MKTRTHPIPIGFRHLRFSDWQRDLPALAKWTKQNNFEFIDLGPDADQQAPIFLDAGLSIGSADLPDWQGLITPDAERQKRSIANCTAYIERCTRHGIRNFFIVMLPDKPDRPRTENFALMVDSMTQLSPVFDRTNTRLVIEGWPGPGALCCTPESVRALFKACPSTNIGLNFDPSHLLRMNIDPLRFLEEFAPRVHHFHAKDTEWFTETIYELGTEQAPTWAKPHDFGGHAWRYTIPGHGAFRWTRALEILAAHNYPAHGGRISVELEDEHFNGTPESEKQGLIVSAQYLATC